MYDYIFIMISFKLDDILMKSYVYEVTDFRKLQIEDCQNLNKQKQGQKLSIKM